MEDVTSCGLNRRNYVYFMYCVTSVESAALDVKYECHALCLKYCCYYQLSDQVQNECLLLSMYMKKNEGFLLSMSFLYQHTMSHFDFEQCLYIFLFNSDLDFIIEPLCILMCIIQRNHKCINSC